MRKLIVANWKMNPASLGTAEKIFVESLKGAKKGNIEVVICPPTPFIAPLYALSKRYKVSLGAQDVSVEKEGPFTGEIGSAMLKSVGVKYCVVGHSERRARGETSSEINKKLKILLKEKITPILCIGELQRDSDGGHFRTLQKEFQDCLQGISKVEAGKIVVAYEPVWAISTAGNGPMSDHEVAESLVFLRRVAADKFGGEVAKKMSFLYGGSVNIKNAQSLLNLRDVEGFLVGKDSLNPVHFKKILQFSCA